MSDIRSAAQVKARREIEIRNQMTSIFTAHREAKEAFIARMNEGQLLNAFVLRSMISTQADMMPWGRVQQLVRTGTNIYNAMLEVRKHSINTLIGYGEAQTSDMLATDMDRAEREGMRRFIKITARYLPAATPPPPPANESVEKSAEDKSSELEPHVALAAKLIRGEAETVQKAGQFPLAMHLRQIADGVETGAVSGDGGASSTDGE